MHYFVDDLVLKVGASRFINFYTFNLAKTLFPSEIGLNVIIKLDF